MTGQIDSWNMNKKSHNNRLELKATPEKESFRGKYESGGIGNKLLDDYFVAVRELTEIAKITENKNVKAIEIGCGEGLSTERLSSFIPNNLTLEASEYVNHQIPLAKKNNPGIRITQESIYQLNHKDESFDVVYLLEAVSYTHLTLPTILRV